VCGFIGRSLPLFFFFFSNNRNHFRPFGPSTLSLYKSFRVYFASFVGTPCRQHAYALHTPILLSLDAVSSNFTPLNLQISFPSTVDTMMPSPQLFPRGLLFFLFFFYTKRCSLSYCLHLSQLSSQDISIQHFSFAHEIDFKRVDITRYLFEEKANISYSKDVGS